MKDLTYALERTVHFLSENRNKRCTWHREVRITAEKCAGCQELLQGRELCSGAGRRGA